MASGSVDSHLFNLRLKFRSGKEKNPCAFTYTYSTLSTPLNVKVYLEDAHNTYRQQRNLLADSLIVSYD